ncbi:MAG: 16S rRNA pseudouridine(516) synthase, partial [Clostridiales bacterium]|nr:16S rRNA pseudouridine(516) synthase [Clostridiales bacterium]
KTYYVETEGSLSDGDEAAFSDGIVLRDGLLCLPARLEILTSGAKSTAYVKLREGKYHQVKRMLASCGKPVTYLKRVAIGGLKLDGRLAAGQYRELTDEETDLVFNGDCDI